MENQLSPKQKKLRIVIVLILAIPVIIGFILEMSGIDVNRALDKAIGIERGDQKNKVESLNITSKNQDSNNSKYIIPKDFFNKTLYQWNYYFCNQEALTLKKDCSFEWRISSIGVNPDYLFIKGKLNSDGTISFYGDNTYKWSYDYKPTTILNKWEVTKKNLTVGDNFIEKPHITLYRKGFNTIEGREVEEECCFTLTHCSN